MDFAIRIRVADDFGGLDEDEVARMLEDAIAKMWGAHLDGARQVEAVLEVERIEAI